MPPVRIAVVNDYEIVVAGVAAMLHPFADRVVVHELAAGAQVSTDVDVVLYDTFGQVQGDGVDLEDLVHGSGALVCIYSWNVQPELVQTALSRGAAGYLSKALSAEEVVAAIEAIARGEIVQITREGDSGQEAPGAEWPGREYGLTQREAEVVALITQGLTNQEIASRAYISINSVKTYIRTAYRKIGVTRRSQAVVWGMKHGFEPDRLRLVGAPAPSTSSSPD